MGILDFIKKKQSAPTQNPNGGVSGVSDPKSLSLPDIIAPSAINISPRSINVSGRLSRIFYAISYPRYLNDGWLEPVLNMEREMDVTIMVHPVDTADTLKKFQKKVAEVQSQINIRAEKGQVRDPQLDAAYRNLEDLRDKLQQAEERLFDVGLYIAIYGDTEADLNKVETELKGILDARLVYLKPALFQQEQGFRSVLPINRDELLVHNKFNSSPLSSFFPFTIY